jgi:hypothetical protein
MDSETANQILNSDPSLAAVREKYQAPPSTSAQPPASPQPPATSTPPELKAQRAELREHLRGDQLTERERAEGMALLVTLSLTRSPSPATRCG